MASGEGAEQTCSSSSVLRLEALLPPEEDERAGGDGDPELIRLRDDLQEWLSQYEPVILWVQRLLVWERPLYSIFVAFMLNTTFWLVLSTTMRPLFLLSVSLLGLLLLERWKHKLPHISVSRPEVSLAERESGAIHPRLLSIAELSHHLAESYHACCLHLQETLQYKRQNHGKFCGFMCAGSLVLAVVGHYVPGVMISYIILLSVLLWPLVVYNELIQKMYTGLEPILMKLDYSMKGDTQHHKHDKRKVKETEGGDEPMAETESESEEELSCFAPTVDVKTTALAMAITDSELSDEEASILESGGFSVSRATTPQLIDVSEGSTDVDQQSRTSDPEEGFPRDLQECPLTKRHPQPRPARPLGSSDTGEERPLPCLHLPPPLHFVNTHFNGNRRGSTGAEQGAAEGQSLSLEALSQEIVSSAISTVVQNTLSALTRLAGPPEAEAQDTMPAETDPVDQTTSAAEEEEEEEEDEEEEEEFVLLDQSELEQTEEELGLVSAGQERDEATPTDPPSGQLQES
ncbi:reticulophagy regulator 2-like [Conger conger]|uniref:reticulophagy regulator 2-like n=1 Tax=Conger conger TaxID=82655 RepID=UPI002A5B0AEC|nr:reticulophagy regulator 2-like [Conger conger]